MMAINVFIIVNSCLPGQQSTNASNFIVEPVKNIINSIKADTINETNIQQFSSVIRKLVGHFSLFVLSGVFTTLTIKFFYYDENEKLWQLCFISCIFGIFLASLTEIIQTFVPGRSGEFGDVLIDFSGYLLAFLIIVLIVYLKNKKTTNLEKTN